MTTRVENILSVHQQRQLNAITANADALAVRQRNLSTGYRVNSALDNPANFFDARALKFRAGDLTRLLDNITRSLQTIKIAQQGLKNALQIIDLAEAYLSGVEQDILNGEIDFTESTDTSTPDNVTEMTFSDPSDLQGYAGAQDGVGVVSVLGGGDGVELDGNLWKKLPINYTVTSDTVLEFDFSSGNIPEIAAIGFDNDDNFGNSNNQFFLYGTQTSGITYAAPTGTYEYSGSGSFEHVEIPIGTFFTGTFSHMTFINDDDGGGDDGESLYRNIILREGPVPEPETIQTGPQRLEDEYGAILDQLDALVLDSDYLGINLLGGENLTTFFNESRTSKLETEGIEATSAGLGLTRTGFDSLEDVRLKLEDIRSARGELRNYASTIANDLNITQIRERFTKETVNMLEEGSDRLTLADLNEEGAKLLALQVRREVQISVLSAPAPTLAGRL